MTKSKSNLPYIALILMQSVVYGLGNPLTKVGFESITALWCLAVRFGGASLLLLLIFGRKTMNAMKAVSVWTWLPCSLSMAVAYISCNLALQFTTATNVGFLMSLPVLFTPFLEVLLLKRKYRFRSIPVQLMVVVGLYLLCCGNTGSFSFGLGEILALVCALAVAMALVFSERSLSSLSPIPMATAQTSVTAIICIVVAFIFDDVAVLPGVQPKAWLVVAYLAVTCTCLAYVLQNTALTRLSSYAVSMLQCTQPILTALFSFIILKETLTVTGLLGAGIITICVVFENYVNYKEARREKEIRIG